MSPRRAASGGCVVLVALAVASPLAHDRAAAAPAEAPTGSTRLRVPWPKRAVLDEAAFAADINALRASRGLHALKVRPNLTRKARRWATTMAAARRIWHSRLSTGVIGNWRKLGENVGMGPSEPSLHAAFVASSTHLDNIVDPAFEYVGVGVVAVDGIMFVSQVFMEPSSTECRRALRAPCRTAKRAMPAHRPHRGQPPAEAATARYPGLTVGSPRGWWTWMKPLPSLP